MISLVRNIVFMLGKRGELRNKDVLLAPKFSSLIRISEFLSSRVLLFKKLVNYSHILFRVSIDPRVKPEGDERRKNVPEGDERRKNVPEGDNLYQVMPRLGTNRSGIFELDDKLNNRKIPGIFCDEKNRDDLNLRKTIFKQSSLQAVTRGQAIFELEKNKIGRSFDVFWRKRGMTSLKDWLGGMTVKNKCNRGMTINVVVFSLFLLFPNLSYSATVFLPDAQNEEVFNSLSTPPVVSIDSVLCEEIGYTYYSSGQCPAYHNQETCVFSDKYLKCDGEGWCLDNSYTMSSCTSPKIVDTQCPNGLLWYKYCVCPTTYKYACTGTGYSSGSGTVCESKYTSCNCATNYVWTGTACVCDSSFKYSCSGTGYSSGSGVACGGKYKSCNCSTYYSWNGSACTHSHSYTCPSGYSTSSSGMISPVTTSKVCQLSGCSSTSGTCYKEGHTHSYSCPSGSYSSSSSCSYGTSGTTSKVCSCGATSGTCYKCASGHTHSYSCPSGSYSSSSSCSYGVSSYVSKVCSCGATSGTCYVCASGSSHSHSYSCPSGSYSSCSNGYSSTVSKECSCGATSGICYICDEGAHTHSYSCPSGYSKSCSSGHGYSDTASKECSCGATSSDICYDCIEHDYECPSGAYSSSSKANRSCTYGYYSVDGVCSCGATNTCYACIPVVVHTCVSVSICEGLGGIAYDNNRKKCSVECNELDCTEEQVACENEGYTYYKGYCSGYLGSTGVCGVDF